MTSGFSKLCFLFLLPFLIYAQDFKVISSNENGLTIEYSPRIRKGSKTINGRKYVYYDYSHAIPDEGLKPGEPFLTHRAFDVGVPSSNGNTLQVLSYSSHLERGNLLFKSNLIKRGEFFVDDFSSAEIKPVRRIIHPVDFGKFGYVRNLPVQTILVHPVIPEENGTVRVYDRIVFRINFSPAERAKNFGNEDKFLKGAVLNYPVAKRWIRGGEKLLKERKNSVLAEGTWYRFPIEKEGIYKISRAELANYGIDPATVDPRTIKIYNNGGYMLPWDPSTQVADDLTENAIYVKGEEDGKFDDNDYILFYARGTDFFEYDKNVGVIRRRKDYYSHKNYYFITSGGADGKRMEIQNSLDESQKYVQTTTKARTFFEEDKINLIKSGVIYLGDEFTSSNNSRTYVTSLPGLIPNSKITYAFNFVNNYSSSEVLEIYENGTKIFRGGIPGAFGWSVASALSSYFYFTGELPDNRSSLKFVYKATSVSAKGYLDYFEIYYDRYLKANNDQLLFYSKDTSSVIEYNLMNFSNSFIYGFNISDFSDVKRISPKMLSGGEFVFQAREKSNDVNKYLVLNSSKFLTPPKGTKVENSNLHGFTGAEYVIITVRAFSNAARKLAEFRSSQASEKLSSVVVYMDEIYNEFSSGNLDPTAIRNFLKYAFENWEIKPFYVLLLGDGDYDYLNVEKQNRNFVPVFETEGSFDEVYSYPFDDYFARISGDDEKADIAIGRITAGSADEAEAAVEKIIQYESDSESGLWRNRITLVADDGLTSKGNDGNEHTAQAETLARYHTPPYFNLNKLYLSMFPTVNTGLGRRKPRVNEEIINAVNNGTLIMSFTGHGNPQVWTHEVVFDRDVSIAQMKNDKYFFLIAATCDFGRYDDPSILSGTEEMLLKKDGGTIGTVASVRPVFSQSNAKLAYDYFDYLLKSRDVYNLPRTLGKAFFLLKEKRFSPNDEKYHLFGDPALRLKIPRLPVGIDSINGVALGINVRLSALGKGKISGSVLLGDGSVNTSANGRAIISVFDSKRSMYLRDIKYTVELQGGLLFRGLVSVENGRFGTEFVIPKDISYENKNGKVVAYFFNDATDGIGYNDNFTVGGTDSTAKNDGKGPKIEIYFDDENFKNSYLVNPDFRLIVKLHDETGLNTTGLGIGHKLEAVLNDDEADAIDLTNYFIADLNSGGKSGSVNYRFTDLAEGDYKLKVKAWDVFNNLSTQQTYFSVVGGGGLAVRDVYNYPNPFSGNTYFTFQQNLTEPVDVEINIYTVAGRLVKKIEEYSVAEKFVKIFWDGRDEDGNLLANGTYLYKLIVRSADSKFKKDFLGKLSILR